MMQHLQSGVQRFVENEMEPMPFGCRTTWVKDEKGLPRLVADWEIKE
jgi:hypothetical protein